MHMRVLYELYIEPYIRAYQQDTFCDIDKRHYKAIF